MSTPVAGVEEAGLEDEKNVCLMFLHLPIVVTIKTCLSPRPAGTLFYTSIPEEEVACVDKGAVVEDGSLVYTGTPGIDDEVPV